MASLGWSIYKYNNSTLSWDADGTINRPNDTFVLEYLHNQQTVQLADGSLAFQTPETKTVDQPLAFVWYYQSETDVTKLDGYKTNNDYLKIVTHVGGREFIGRFTDVRYHWLVGESPDKYDIEGVFQIME